MILSNTKSKKTSGFTLVELLVVIVVIAILAAITIVAYNGITDRAKAAKYQSEAQTIAKKSELLNALTGKYPSNSGVTGTDATTITKQSLSAVFVQSLYLSALTSNATTSPQEAALPAKGGLGIFGVLTPDSTTIPTYNQTLNGINVQQSNLATTDFAPGDYYFIMGCSAGGMKIFYPIPTNKTTGTITLGSC